MRHSFQCLIVSSAMIVASSLAASAQIRFAVIGDYGVDNANQAAVATRVNAFAPDFITTTGDNTYFVGAAPAADFANWDKTQGKYYSNYIKLPAGSAFGPGAATNNFFPVMGNHDWDEGSASFSDYFELPTGATPTSGERYYSFRRGDVDFFMLSSDPREPDGRSAGSTQYNWARNAIRASTAAWQIVMLHQPAYTYASSHGAMTQMRLPFQAWGVDAVFSGHQHNMMDMTVNDTATGNTSLPYFVQGASGNRLYAINGPPSLATGNWSNASSFGFSMVEATSTTAVVKFYDAAGNELHTRSLTQIPLGTEPPPPPPTPLPTPAAFGPGGFSENFDAIGAGGTAAPAGFQMVNIAGGNSTFTNATGIPASGVVGGTVVSPMVAASDPASNNVNGYNAAFNASPTDRALATAPTGIAGSVIELRLVNNSNFDQPAINVAFDVDRFTTRPGDTELPGYCVFYSLDDGVTWFEIPVLRGDLTNTPNDSTGTFSFLPTLVTLAGDWDKNETLLLRWVDDNSGASSPDQIVGIDNVAVTPTVVP